MNPAVAIDASINSPRATHSRPSAYLWAILAALALLFAARAQAFSTGITTQSFGTFGCNSCHSGGILPTVTVTGPTNVLPLQANTYTVTVDNPVGQSNAGFNVSALSGVLATGGAESAQTQTLVGAGGRTEVTHSSRKAASGGQTIFSFQWTAPSSFLSVSLDLWGNAVNGNGDSSGDGAAMTGLVVYNAAIPSATATNSPSVTPTPTTTASQTATPTLTPTPTATASATYTPPPSATLTATATASVTLTPTPFAVDHFRMYRAKAVGFATQPALQLDDEFGSKLTTIGRPRWFGLPVDKDGEGILHPAIKLQCYSIRDARTPASGRFAAHRVAVSNQFGDGVLLEATKSAEICLPALASALEVPSQPVPSHNSFKCYKAKRASGEAKLAPFDVELSDELQGSNRATVLAPVRVCNPITNLSPTNALAYLVCYKITSSRAVMQPKFSPTQVSTVDPFGNLEQTATKSSMLCVPSSNVDLGVSPDLR